MFDLFDLLRAYRKSDPASRSLAEILLLYPGVKAVATHRLAHALHRAGIPFLPRLLSELSRIATGIEIHPGARIGRRLVIDHGMGVVIGETAEVGNDVIIYQAVTLGGTSLARVKRHPTVGNGAVLGAGAKILGDIQIGEGARVGANSVVLKDVPPHTSVAGVPARKIEKEIV